mmetsp:Transcript_46874/g.119579  ORF Transcript_46874/g.119579 Transcript_46874/m.119579 type:complete len:267 (+) Transcript_46874:495-1295(+)
MGSAGGEHQLQNGLLPARSAVVSRRGSRRRRGHGRLDQGDAHTTDPGCRGLSVADKAAQGRRRRGDCPVLLHATPRRQAHAPVQPRQRGGPGPDAALLPGALQPPEGQHPGVRLQRLRREQRLRHRQQLHRGHRRVLRVPAGEVRHQAGAGCAVRPVRRHRPLRGPRGAHARAGRPGPAQPAALRRARAEPHPQALAQLGGHLPQHPPHAQSQVPHDRAARHGGRGDRHHARPQAARAGAPEGGAAVAGGLQPPEPGDQPGVPAAP